MIAEFRVKNFLSIKTEQCLSFEATADTLMKEEYSVEVKEGVHLLKFALVYGANASGKTNILLAISFFQDLMLQIPKDKTKKINLEPFMLDNNSRNELSELSMSFYLKQEKYILSVKLNNNRILNETLIYYPGAQPAKLYTRTYNESTDATSIEFGTKLGLSKKNQDAIEGNTINNCSVIAAFGKSNVESSRLNVVYDFFSDKINNLLRPGDDLSGYVKRELQEDENNSLKPFLINVLKASDFNITDLELVKEEKLITPEMEEMISTLDVPEEAKKQLIQKGKITNYELLFKHKTEEGEFVLPESSESRGTTRFMGITAILKQLLLNNHIMLIDEVETSLHYELLSYFIKVFLANTINDSQLIMTTHDINLLNEDFIRRDAVWFTDKDTLGQTNLTRLSSLGLHKNLSPYNAYRQGKLVKLPFFGSIYLKGDNLCDQK